MARNQRRSQAVGVRRQARAQETRRRARRAGAQGRSLIGRLLALLPFTDEQLRRAFTVLILGGAAAGLWAIASVSGATVWAGERFAQASANAGFVVRHVEVRGARRMNESAIYTRAFGRRDLAMAKVDLAQLRGELLELPWVKDARVSRQLPDVLVIDIVERTPHAVLALPDRLMLIDAGGEELETVRERDAQGMLRLSGPGVKAQVGALGTLLDAAPALRAHVSAAEWVGNRRWNLTFDSGQRLALPEGERRAAAALIAFARADGVHRLLGGEVTAFDMRNPPRMYLRVPGRSARQELDLQAPAQQEQE